MDFTHLHVHTEYSLLDGAARIKDVIARAKEMGMDALAITDHGVMFGVVDFYKECKKQGIKPIIGCEVYLAKRSRFDKEAEKDREPGHLLLLAETDEGYRNLIKIVTRGYTEGFYYKPRVDREVLRKYSRGIIATSACLAGFVQQHLLNNDYEAAKEEVLAMKEIFGEGNYFLELQDQGLQSEAYVLPGMMRLREETGVPFVATNDVHYVNREDAAAHDVLLCIQTQSTLDEPNRLRFPNDQFYLKSREEMAALFEKIPEAIENTRVIADRCNVNFDFNNYHIPDFTAPDGKDNKTYLRELCEQGLRERYGEPTFELQKRLDYELGTIMEMGYTEYFLIVWDFINYAKGKGIMVGPGRGSAAGSLVSYCLYITDIDPLKYTLLFERFLNPERVSMPDIDIDFCYERRGEVIDYVIEKYGEDRVSQIITFGTMKAKAAVRDVGRVLGVSYKDTDAIAKAIPRDLDITIDKALAMNPDLAKAYEEDPVVRRVLDVSKAIEGMPRHASTHAAGVVISKEPIDEYVPLYVGDRGPATQFTMTTIEELGLLKMDFLGLRNLTIIRDALAMIKANHGVDIDLSSMTYDDPKVYEMIAAGNTQGIFQLESAGMTQFMKNLRPDCFEDIVAGISLYRPGPMASIPTYIENKKHPEKIRYLHESLEPILGVTYGCMVYQEQVMQIVRDLAGYSLGHSDILRRAMSKKKMDVMLAEKEEFLKGAEERGVPRSAGEAIFNQMISFAQYAFNKSHAAAYAVVGYETAYLKCHYPEEFMAALLTSVMGDAKQVAKYVRNCKEMGITVRPPDINESDKKFTVSAPSTIRFGLLGIKNLGAGAIDNIIKVREEKGPYKDIFTFMESIDPTAVNKKACESLIKAGAFDRLEENRAGLMAVYEGLLERAQQDAKVALSGQISLFQTNEQAMEKTAQRELPAVKNFDQDVLSSMEKEMLGLYLSGHPLDPYQEALERMTTCTLDALQEPEDNDLADGMEVTLAGLVTGVKVLVTKKNQQMAFVDIEDYFADAEIIVFPKTYERYHHLLMEDAPVVIRGKLDHKDEGVSVLADHIMGLSEALEIAADRRSVAPAREGAPPTGNGVTPVESQPRPVCEHGGPGAGQPQQILVKVRIPREADYDTVSKVQQLLAHHPGNDSVLLYMPDMNKPLRARNGVSADAAFIKLLGNLIGADNVKSEAR